MMGKTKYQLAVVIPVYNEEACIVGVVRSWHEELTRLEIDFIIIVLNDGSTDETKARLEFFREIDRVMVINKKNSGHGPTILAGYHTGVKIADWVFQTDSDNEMKPDYFFELWRRRDFYDALFGIRENRRQTLDRKLVTLISRIIVRIIFGSAIVDVNVPYRLMKSPILEKIINVMPSDTFAPNVIISGALATLSVRTFNYQVPHESRKTGVCSLNRKKFFKAALKSFHQLLNYRYEVKFKQE